MAMSDHPAGTARLWDRNPADQFVPDDAAVDAVDDDGAGAWVPDNLGQADWSARRAQRWRRQMAEACAVAQAELDELHVEVRQLEAFIAKEQARYLEKIARAEGAVTAYHRHIWQVEELEGVPDRDRTRTLRLPCGAVSERRVAGGSRPVIVDDGAALVADGDLTVLRHVPEQWVPDKAAIRRLLEAGHAVPGCRLGEKEASWELRQGEGV